MSGVAFLRKDQIILEKVASARPGVSKEAATNLTDKLIGYGIVKEASREAMITQFQNEPDSIAKLAAALAPVSVPPPSQGAGIAKEASSTDRQSRDTDGFYKIAEEGA